MKIIEFFKKLNSKVETYDKVAKNPFLNSVGNPFSKPYSITLVWVDEEKDNKK